MAGGVVLVGGAAYDATKASLEAMTRAWAAEYSASGVVALTGQHLNHETVEAIGRLHRRL